MTDEFAMIKQVESSEMTTWSDEKKRDFTTTFKQRVEASQALLKLTAEYIANGAIEKRFISRKHTSKFSGNGCGYGLSFGIDRNRLGGRSFEELQRLAQDRAAQVLKELPLLKTAVSVLTPDVAKKIEELDVIKAKGQKLTDQLIELSEPISMSELDQSMTIGDFRKMVKTTEKKRKVIINQLEEYGKTGRELDTAICKALYSGIPGLSDAIVKAIQTHIDRAQALDQLGRRVEEQVMFGDSTAAIEILRSFEKDEVELSGEIKIEFKKALDTLMARKQLKGKVK